jgi:hypothetical protein
MPLLARQLVGRIRPYPLMRGDPTRLETILYGRSRARPRSTGDPRSQLSVDPVAVDALNLVSSKLSSYVVCHSLAGRFTARYKGFT